MYVEKFLYANLLECVYEYRLSTHTVTISSDVASMLKVGMGGVP